MALLPLANGGHARVDDDLVDFLSQWTWWRDSKGYAVRRERRRAILMHRVVMGAGPGQEVDHKAGDRLDNRRDSLRFARPLDQAANRVKPAASASPYKGVRVWRRRFIARIRRGRLLHLGSFPSAHQAAVAYDVAATLLFGAFARPNLGWSRAEAAANLGLSEEAVAAIVSAVEAKVVEFLRQDGTRASDVDVTPRGSGSGKRTTNFRPPLTPGGHSPPAARARRSSRKRSETGRS